MVIPVLIIVATGIHGRAGEPPTQPAKPPVKETGPAAEPRRQAAHPRLLFGAESIPRLRARLGNGNVRGLAGAALTGLLKGERDEPSIKKLLNADNNTAYEALLIYDFQYPFMTDEEHTKAREWLLGDAERLLRAAEARRMWYFTEVTNNWVISHMTRWALQRILFTGILFPEDPRAAAMRRQGITLLKYFLLPEKDIEILAESLTSVNGYGTYDLDNLGYIMMAVDRHKGLCEMDPFGYHDRMLHQEGRYRTYLFQTTDSAKSVVYGCANHPNPRASGIYAVPLGGHGAYRGHSMLKPGLLWLTGAYKEPVFAWLYLKSLRRTDWPTDSNFSDVRDLLYRGIVQPRSPEEAGWPLEAVFPKAGVAIMRSSWADDASVVVAHAGFIGSHPQPKQGQVVFTGRGWTVLGHMDGLGTAERGSGYGGALGQFYSFSPHTNNIIFVDGRSQPGLYMDGRSCRGKLGSLQVLGANRYELDASIAYHGTYPERYRMRPGMQPRAVFPKLKWNRTVHYNRAGDVLLVEDDVDVGDGMAHEVMFNWVTVAKVEDNRTYDLPGPYVMVAEVLESATPLAAAVKNHHDRWPALEVTVRAAAGRVKVRWAVGPDMRAVQDAARAGVNVGNISH